MARGGFNRINFVHCADGDAAAVGSRCDCGPDNCRGVETVSNVDDGRLPPTPEPQLTGMGQMPDGTRGRSSRLWRRGS